MSDSGIVVDGSCNTIRISRTYAAKVERAWLAWTEPKLIEKWWGPTGWTAVVHEMDVRPGGRWRFEITPKDGSAHPVRGIATYSSVVRHVELAFEDSFADEAWQPDGSESYPTSVAFSPVGTGCQVEVQACFPDSEALQRAVEARMAEGYAGALEQLEHLLRTTKETT